MDPDPASLRHPLEERWRRKLRLARDRYEAAAARFQVAVDENTVAPTSEGSLTVRQARAAESVALKEYMKTLRIFGDLVVRGTMPQGE